MSIMVQYSVYVYGTNQTAMNQFISDLDAAVSGSSGVYTGTYPNYFSTISYFSDPQANRVTFFQFLENAFVSSSNYGVQVSVYDQTCEWV